MAPRPCLRCADSITGPGPKKLCDSCGAEWAWCPKCSTVLPLGGFTTRRKTGHRTAYCAQCEYVRHLTTKHGIPEADARVLAAIEECEICHTPPIPGDRLHVDHDHETGEIRGVLCRWCNYAAAVLEDDRLTQVQAYLARRRRHLRVVE